MTAAVERGATFGPVELDLLATHAGVRFPFPLRVPSSGRTAPERDALLASAAHGLCARGLATGRGPVGVADELVDALRGHRGAVDLVVVGADGVTGAVAMVHRDRAVVCRQSPDGAVLVTPVGATALGDELAALVPAVPAAPVLPVTLPPGVVDDALRLLGDASTGAGTGRQLVRDLVRSRGGDGAAVDRLIDLLPVVLGRGQLGVVCRSGTGRPVELSWLDGPRGRVRVDRGASGWTSVNPLRHHELVRVLGEAAEVARA
ncbi:ESX secretion-associated protein EspG [Saccharothrix syringae]|uniref:ESX secretion-associated protein EspG n=1 Tax=Saccharothrix syringae TaxID=103733 RepID=A0A5Q0H047_SACSY|nr:ESX secretion-associated protein EspG [Saccharothrix syringae]QFZ19597.1 ESX secretion-associated protein EspG [Saccharothrix syringae]